MTDSRKKLISVLKLLIVLFLMTVLAVIAINFISSFKKQPEAARLEQPVPPKSKEKKEKIEFIENDGEKESLRGLADEHFEGEDGQIHARGNVWLRHLGKYELTAEEIIYDREQTRFLLQGNSIIRFEDAQLEGSTLVYDREENVFQTEKGALFSSERMNVSARRVRYFIDREELELSGGIRLHFTPRLDTSFPLFVEAEYLTYSRVSKKGRIEGGVAFFHGRSRGKADSVGFELYESEEHVRFVYLEGNAEAVLSEERDKGIERRVQADKIFLQTFLNFFKVHAFEATDHCHFRFISPEGDTTEGESDFLKFVLSRTGDLREFHAIGNARLLEADGQTNNRRSIEGESLVIVEAVKGLQIKGSPEMSARLQTELFEISAGDILLDIDNNHFSAAEGVKVILNSDNGEKPMGFFSRDKSVFITADEMRYDDRLERFIFWGGAKSWQEKEMLTAGELVIDRKNGRIFGEGGVTAVFPYMSKSRDEEVRVGVEGRKMDIDPDSRTVVFREQCSLRAGEVGLSSDSIRVDMEEDGAGMQKMLAEGHVIIFRQQFEGRGRRAQFDVENETIVLYGNAVLMDRNRGKVEGDKLTFYLADDRIVVENQGQERSFSVIKS